MLKFETENRFLFYTTPYQFRFVENLNQLVVLARYAVWRMKFDIIQKIKSHGVCNVTALLMLYSVDQCITLVWIRVTLFREILERSFSSEINPLDNNVNSRSNN